MPYFEDRRPTKQALLTRLNSNVVAAREARKPWLDIWRTTYDYYCSDPHTSYDPNGFKIHANLPFAWYESIWPSIAFHNPVFFARGISGESKSAARTVSKAVTAELKRKGMRGLLRKVCYDGLLYGAGIWQLGYYDRGLVGKSQRSQDQADAFGSSDLAYGFRPGEIYMQPIRPHRFLIDPFATGLDDALWCGCEYVRDVQAVRNDPQYKNASRIEANETDLPDGMSLDEYRKRFWREPERSLVRIVQIHDIVDRRIYAIVPGHNEIIGEWPMTLPVDRYPFYIFNPADDFDSFWRQGPMIPWLNLVEEYNLAISRRLNHLDRFKRKYIYDAGAVDPEEVKKLEMPVDGLIVSARPNTGDVRAAIAAVPEATISGDSYAFTREAMEQWRFISGVSELDLGSMRPGERPAAEIQRMAAGANARRQGLAGRLGFALEQFAGDVRAVMEQFYTEERVVEITGERGEMEWVKYDGSALRGKYLFECDIGDLGAKSPQDREMEAARKLQFLAPFSQVGSQMPLIDITPQLIDGAAEMGIQNLRFFPQAQPPMDPVAEWHDMLRKGVALAPNAMDDHALHIFIHEAQLEHPMTFRDPGGSERLRNHLEAHRAFLLSAQVAQQAMQKKQNGASQNGRPGPASGNSNNPGGGGGVFATGAGQQNQDQLGGFTGQNLQELLRGGAL